MDIQSPNGQVTTWLARFDAALAAGNAHAAAALFAPTSYWRDFVSLTWNLKTMEGRGAIESMLGATLAAIKPTKWTLRGDATEVDGIIEGWVDFETETGRGEGHIRLNDEGCWTLLTTLRELRVRTH